MMRILVTRVRSAFVGVLVCGMLVAGSVIAQAEVLTFDNVPINSFGSFDLSLNGGYGGLGWSVVGFQSETLYMTGAGNSYGFPSGEWAVFSGGPVSVQRRVESAPGSCCVLAPFDFVGAEFTPYTLNDGMWHNAATSMTMNGWRNGHLLYSTQVDLSPGFRFLPANFVGIDTLELRPNGSAFSFSRQFLMDNFLFENRGTTPQSPVLPHSSPQPHEFVFNHPGPGFWYDPPFAEAYTYSLSGGAFTQLQTPDSSFGFGDLLFSDLSGGNASFVAMAGVLYNLLPTSSFMLSGIPDGLIDFQAADFDAAFPVYLNWNGDASALDIQVTPQQGVPEPATGVLMLSALVAAARCRRSA